MKGLLRRVAFLFHWKRQNRDQDLRDELAAHVAMDVHERLATGDSPAAARRAAQRDLGNPTRIAEDTTAALGWSAPEQLLQDFRHALRSARRHPGFVASSVLTLALAIGGTSAIAVFVYFALLRPLPFEQPDRLVRVYEAESRPLAPPTFLDWQAQHHVFDRLAAFQRAPQTIRTLDGPEQVSGMQVSKDFFAVLGVRPILGRDFMPEEDRPGAAPVVIVTHEFWQERLAGDVNALGSPLMLGGEPAILVGVLPRGFRFINETSVWRPLRLGSQPQRMKRSERYLQAVGRLRHDVSIQKADAELTTFELQGAQERGERQPTSGPGVVSIRDSGAGDLQPSLVVLLSASAVVLLIGCTNLTSLLLARSLARERELAIRTALGGGRSRLLRHLATEGAVIGLLGGVAGTLLGVSGIKIAMPLLSRMGGSYAFAVVRLSNVDLTSAVVMFGLSLSVAAAVFCALVTGLHATRGHREGTLHPAGRSATDTLRGARLRSALVVSQIALTFVLLVGAGLLVNSLWRLRHVDLGFEAQGVITMGLHSSPQEAADFYRDVLQRVRSFPDVESASVVSSLPLAGADLMTGFDIQGRPRAADQRRPEAVVKVVGTGYFETMKIPVVEGRYFDIRDAEDSESVVVINQAVARNLWPGRSPLGQRIQRGGPQRPWSTIVGVVQDVKVSGPATETPLEIYVPHSQFVLVPNTRLTLPNMVLVVRTASPTARVVPLVRSQISALNGNSLITNIVTMPDTLARVMAPSELNTLVVTVFATLALSLAIVGVYGVMSYTATRRQHEIGVRMALGARRLQVMMLILRQAVVIVTLGTGLGVAAAALAGRSMTALLFNVHPGDPLTYAATMLVVVTVSLLASYVPARRAVRANPLRTLRAD